MNFKAYTWVEAYWFGAWTTGWCKEVKENGLLVQMADDAPGRFFSWNLCRPVGSQRVVNFPAVITPPPTQLGRQILEESR